MWGNQAKWVWTWAHHILNFLLDVILHSKLCSKIFVLLKTPLKLDMSVQSYDLLKGCQNNREQKDLFPLFGRVSKSIFASSNSVCLITSHTQTLVRKVPFKLVIMSSWRKYVRNSVTETLIVPFHVDKSI